MVMVTRLQLWMKRVAFNKQHQVAARARAARLSEEKCDRKSADTAQDAIKSEKQSEVTAKKKKRKPGGAGSLFTVEERAAAGKLAVPKLPQSATGYLNLTGSKMADQGGAALITKKYLAQELLARGVVVPAVKKGVNVGTPTEKLPVLLQKLAFAEDDKWTEAVFSQAMKDRTPVKVLKKTDPEWGSEWRTR